MFLNEFNEENLNFLNDELSNYKNNLKNLTEGLYFLNLLDSLSNDNKNKIPVLNNLNHTLNSHSQITYEM